MNAVAWSPDGSIFAVACWPPTVPHNETELKSYQAWFDHRDHSFFDSRSEDDDHPKEEVRLFESASGQFIRSIAGYGTGVAFAPDGQSLAVASWSSLCIVDVESGKRIAVYDGIKESALRNVFYSDDGKLIGCINSNGVMVFDASTAAPCYIATDKHLFSDTNNHDDEFRLTYPPNPPEYVVPEDDAAYVCGFWNQTLPEFRPNNSSDGGMSIQRIAFSPDGHRAAIHRQQGINCRPPCGFTLGGITILDLNSDQKIRFITSPDQKWIRTIAFSPDSKLLAGTGDHQTIFLWNAETGEEIRRIGQPPPAITAVSFARSKPVMAAGATDGTVFLCRYDEPAVVELDRQRRSEIAYVEFGNDDEVLVVADVSGRVRVCGLPSMSSLVEFRPHRCRLLGGMISADGKHFVSVGYDDEPTNRNDSGKPARVIVSRLDDGQEVASHELPDIYPITSVAASPNRNQLAISYQKLVITADVSDEIEIHRIWKQDEDSISKVAYSPSTPNLLLANQAYRMKWIAIGSATWIRSFAATRVQPTSLALTTDGKFVARSTAYFHEIELFDVSSGVLKKYLVGHQSAVRTLAISPDDKILASGGNDGTLKLWSIETGKLRASIVTYPGDLNPSQHWECLSGN